MLIRRYWPDALLLGGFAALTGALTAGWFLGLDVAVRDWCEGHRPAVLYWTARVLNVLGNGTWLALVALGLAVLLARRTRSWRPLLLPVVAFAATSVVVYAFKLWTDRGAPRSDRVELFSGGESYPAGHVVVTIVWYGVIVTLLAALVRLPPRLRLAIRVVPVAVVFVTTIYVSFHWLTDDVAGLLLGLLLGRTVLRSERLSPPSHPAPGPGSAVGPRGPERPAAPPR